MQAGTSVLMQTTTGSCAGERAVASIASLCELLHQPCSVLPAATPATESSDCKQPPARAAVNGSQGASETDVPINSVPNSDACPAYHLHGTCIHAQGDQGCSRKLQGPRVVAAKPAVNSPATLPAAARSKLRRGRAVTRQGSVSSPALRPMCLRGAGLAAFSMVIVSICCLYGLLRAGTAMIAQQDS
jgi:hypothetical protein